MLQGATMLSWHGAECLLYTHKKSRLHWLDKCRNLLPSHVLLDYQAMPPVLTAVVWRLPKGYLMYICCPAKAGLHQHLPSFCAGLTRDYKLQGSAEWYVFRDFPLFASCPADVQLCDRRRLRCRRDQ